ncbi:MAG: bifunctional ADP-dependent NAD(P)H-hydrate dehydratase/NAD(P)H-hydrate epimerase, partial [Pseudomonadales bacterium]|nr:bifunctional ADP-dependent NAD(P)H-hydrate dehydratase/NAD(P)H-hydrate epimerase [Pseudomonadales bacterium]
MSSPHTTIPRDLYLAAQVQQLDRIAIEQFGIEGFTLMRRAGLVCFQALIEQWPDTRRVLVFAGGGNNGGDA